MFKKWMRFCSLFVVAAALAAGFVPVGAVGNVRPAELKIVKTVEITMDESLVSSSLPNDISGVQVAANSFYTAPTEQTSKFAASANDLFYRDDAGSGYIMLNSGSGNQVARFGLDKEGHSDITGFDEIRIRYKTMKVEGWPADEYTEASDYKLKLRLSDWDRTAGGISGSTLQNSKQLNITPTVFTTLNDGVYEEAVLMREDFAGDKLDMDGDLSLRTESGHDHMMLLSFWPATRVCFLIDTVTFVWYGEEEPQDEPMVEITDVSFTNNDGLQAGENTATISLRNMTGTVYENAQYVLALDNTKTGEMEDVKIKGFSLNGEGTVSDLALTVTIPDGADPKDYEARIMLLRSFASMEPLLDKDYRFDGNGKVVR